MEEVDNLIESIQTAFNEELSKAGAAPFLEIGEARHVALRPYRLLLKESLPEDKRSTTPNLYVQDATIIGRKTTIKQDYGFIISISSSSSYIIVMICLFQQSAQKFSSAMSFCSKVMSFVSYISVQMTQMFVGILNTSPHQIKRRDLKVSVISLCRSRWVIMPT
jgi:hypothetical protein